MEKRRTKWIGYLDLIDSFKLPGCPLCNRIKELSWGFLDSLFYEYVNDVGTRVKLIRAKGFCSWHAWMSTEIRNSDSGITIIYNHLLDIEIADLSKWAKARGYEGVRRKLKLRKNRGPLLSSWREKASCPVCINVKDHERWNGGMLLDFIDEEEFYQEFEKSSGICINHLIYIIQTFEKHPNLLLLVETQLKKYQTLSEELGELDRKRDYRFSNEPKGLEVDSWKRVIKQFTGEREIFGNEIDRRK